MESFVYIREIFLTILTHTFITFFCVFLAYNLFYVYALLLCLKLERHHLKPELGSSEYLALKPDLAEMFVAVAY